MSNIVVNKQLSKVLVVNKGVDGVDGVGVPLGGSAGQVLSKASSLSYDTQWVNASSGAGDMLSSNNLSDVANVNTARNNIGAISNVESIVNALIFG